MLLTTDHIDPVVSDLVCGLDVEENRIQQTRSYNARKVNRFVPYRVCDCLAPIAFGDTCEFLISGEWLVCEFGGPEWWAESNRLGNSQTNGGKKAGKKAIEEGVGIYNPELRESEEYKQMLSDIGKKTVEEGVGIHNPEYQASEGYKQMVSDNAKKTVEEGVGIHSPEYRESEEYKQVCSEGGKKTGKKSMEEGFGIYNPEYRESEEFRQSCSEGGKKTAEKGMGIHSPEYRESEEYLKQKSDAGREGGRSTNSQKWMCLVTGYVSNAGALTRYQRAQGIDTSRRVRLTPEEVAFMYAWDPSVQ